MYDLLLAYGPYPSFDDMLWYGLSYLRYYEEFGDEKFLSMSEQIYNWTYKLGWDDGKPPPGPPTPPPWAPPGCYAWNG